MSREPAQHICPAFMKIPKQMFGTILDLHQEDNVGTLSTQFKCNWCCSLAFAMTACPVGTPPVSTIR